MGNHSPKGTCQAWIVSRMISPQWIVDEVSRCRTRMRSAVMRPAPDPVGDRWHVRAHAAWLCHRRSPSRTSVLVCTQVMAWSVMPPSRRSRRRAADDRRWWMACCVRFSSSCTPLERYAMSDTIPLAVLAGIARAVDTLHAWNAALTQARATEGGARPRGRYGATLRYMFAGKRLRERRDQALQPLAMFATRAQALGISLAALYSACGGKPVLEPEEAAVGAWRPRSTARGGA